MTGPETLEAVRAEAFRRLAGGVVDRHSAFHTPTLASIATDGRPELRTLVLRGFDAPTRTLRLHTDRRSGKWASLTAEPLVALHVYDAGAQLQLRLGGRATLHDEDAVAEAAWAGSRPGSRLCYAVEPGPGTPVATPPPAPVPLAGREAGTRANFAVIHLVFDRLEWLHLHHAGHRRALFLWGAEGDAEGGAKPGPSGSRGTWLVP